jgi:hypothetical protein
MAPLPRSTLLGSLAARLKALPRDVSNEAAVAHNLSFMEELAAWDAPRRLVEEVLGDDGLLSLIATRSYEHANHFYKILLVSSDEPHAYRLSIHRWHLGFDDPLPGEEPVHNHRFSFWSNIFRGRMSASTYAEVDGVAQECDVLPKYRYLPTSTGNVHVCQYQGESRLKKVASKTYSAGDVYYLHYNTLHRVHAPGRGEQLCTLVLRGPRERKFADTYNVSYPRSGVAYNTPVMTTDQMRTVLAAILERS